MATKLENRFDIYHLEPLEYKEAIRFTNPQRTLLQSYRGEIAHKILQLSFADSEIQNSITQHKYLTGQLELVEELLDLESNFDASSIESNSDSEL
jgi:hypothetical protein